MTEVAYILGHAEQEIRRLELQSNLLYPITKRLLTEAGLAPGMRVLDLGSGAGDVAMLAAELTGPNGSVVGIDRSPEALTAARERVSNTGHANIEFRQAAAEDFEDPIPFDVVIGRYVLMHQADPPAFIRAAASHVRPGGAIAFHEPAVGYSSFVESGLILEQSMNGITAAFKSVLPHFGVGRRMSAHFRAANLQEPRLFCEIPVGGPDSMIYAWVASTLRNVLPQLEKIGAATAAEIDIDTLEDRLRDAMTVNGGQIHGVAQICAWAEL
jgi:ubiquinone/menaquinone biosynthesis C-methylase UbiE